MDIVSIWNHIADSFVRNMLVEDRYMLIIQGLKTTILITLLSTVFGTVLGGLVCWARMRGNKVVRNIAKFYVDLMRGTPVLVLLLIMYYIILAPVIESAVFVAIITFSMNASAYICEMLRSGIEGIDKGQTEAGLSLGLNRNRTFSLIVLPQVMKNILPVFHGELISLLKSTSIVGYIAIMDMTKASDLIRSRTFDAFFPLIIVAILYFILAWLLGMLLDFLSRNKSKAVVPAMAVLVIFLTIIGFHETGTGAKRDNINGSASIEEIAGHGSVAVMEGSIYDIEYTKMYPKATVFRVKNISEAAEFVLSQKATAMIALDVQTKYVMRENPTLIEMDSLFMATMGAGFPKGSPLKEQFDRFLSDLKSSQDYKDMIHRWIECDIDTVAMPDLGLPATGVPLKMAITGTQTPMNTVRGGEYVGFDVELGMRFAKYLNRPITFEVTTFQGLIPDVVMGRVDIAVSDLIITEERANKIDFSEPYYDSYASILVLDRDSAATASCGNGRTTKFITWILLAVAAALIARFILKRYSFNRKVREYMAGDGGGKSPLKKGDVLIRVTNLEKRFNDGLTVLQGVSTEIRKGEVISVIGPSGTGKSTFLRCLNLLGRPTGGSIVIDGKDILSPYADVSVLRRKMGMVFQSFNLFEGMTVMENITLAPVKLLGKTRAEAADKAMELLRMVGLADKADYYPNELSGGQKQRIAIARALAMEPEILLFDEPTSALDPTMVSEVLGVMRLLAKKGMTMIVVTHEMRFAREVCDRVFFMEQKGIYEDNTPSELFDNPQKELTKVFINQIREVSYKIDSPAYDYYGMMGSIVVFAEKYNMSYRTITNLQLAIEESLNVMGTPAGTEIKVSYSEKTMALTVTVKVPESITDEKFESEDNMISSSILHGISSDFELRNEPDGTTLALILK